MAARARRTVIGRRLSPTGPHTQFGLLLVHSVLTQVITFVVRPTTAYRALEIGVPLTWLGALSASFAVVPLLLAVPSGQATDRWGERRVMLAGALLMLGSSMLLLTQWGGAGGLVLGSVVLGTGHLFSAVGQQAAVANTAGPGRFDTAFGHYTFAASMGQAAGPALITLVGGAGALPTTRPIFLVASVLGVALLGVTVLVRMPGRETDAATTAGGGMGTLLRLPGLVRALTVSSIVLAAVDITLVYLPALGAERGMAAGFVGLLLTLRALASMVSRFFLGRLVALTGRRALMVGSVALSALAMAVLALPLPALVLAVVVALLGLGLGVGQPLTMSWLAETAPAGLRGRALSLRLTGNRLGQVLIPSSVGFLAAGIGSAGVLGATAIALAAAGVAARRLADTGDDKR